MNQPDPETFGPEETRRLIQEMQARQADLESENAALQQRLQARETPLQAQVEEALRESQELLTLFLRHSPIYAYIKEVTPTESRMLQASDNFHDLIGISAQDMVGKTMSELFPAEMAAKMSADDWSVVSKGEVLKLDEDLNGRNYTSIKFPIAHKARTLVAGYTIDITELTRLQATLQQQAGTDELTGITNRRRFLELASTEINRAQHLNHPLAIAVIDMDRLKQINDAHGHAAGDQALMRLTQICQASIRAIDVFARIGGDEFILLLPQINCQQAYEVLQRVSLALASQPLNFDTGSVTLTISAGIAGVAGGDDSVDTLLKRGDRALYLAKKAGRNRVMME